VIKAGENMQPYVDIDERNEWDIGEQPDKAWTIKEIEYA